MGVAINTAGVLIEAQALRPILKVLMTSPVRSRVVAKRVPVEGTVSVSGIQRVDGEEDGVAASRHEYSGYPVSLRPRRDKRFEVEEPSEILEDSVLEDLHPKVEAKKAFSRPKRPGRKMGKPVRNRYRVLK
ncbi:hypothetical protein F4779DRAFT_632559 [Xylariaceae sp. FL0662B]|nr:hypothetical protein F4779DRAFT_632559 [Xylariaceae sp. FL0662B]